MNIHDRTPADLLRSALATDGARPLVTYYDDATGERVELSVATLANWVAKTANLLQDELAAERGDRLALHLPAHWQTAVWLLACSAAGVVADVGGDPAAADLVVSGPDTLEAARACPGERVALALRPLGARFPRPPAGFTDYAVAVPVQPDTFAAYDPTGPSDVAYVVDGAELTGGLAVERARADADTLGLTTGSRVMSLVGYGTWAGISTGLLAPLAVGASVVLCRNAERLAPEALAARRESERVTHFAD
ncbi:TIGR03089 family protein [Streptomyces radicis]|uniref:TIGR03089 family protein n=1 Tax=Streptomyces radicis TaxID=1750517 RepID=A0A3A9W7N6_9ACTN|nr:TIGR03089 family protein [Streptomyces radicis]RKN08742.1 TIGR03089 family protein [Streptomyces radicis]RKN21900.1 TIGR03089 family protein [Streptomyces radicis]